MENFKTTNIENLPFELEKVSDLLSYDGPILSHFTDKYQKHYLAYWVDQDELANRWLFFQVSKEVLKAYLLGKRSLKNILDKTEVLYVLELDDNIEVLSSKIAYIQDLPAQYIPGNKSYYSWTVPDESVAILNLEEDFYIEQLRKAAINIRITNSSLKYSHLLNLEDLLSVLNNLKLTYKNYFTVSFQQYFQKLDKKSTSIIAKSVPFLVDLNYQSFSFSFSPDILKRPDESTDVFKWKKKTYQEYQEDVIYADFKSRSFLQYLNKKFNAEERSLIYSPLLRALNKKNITIMVTDGSYSQVHRMFYSIDKKTKEILAPKPEVIDELNPLAVFNLIAVSSKGDRISKKDIKDLLSVRQIEKFTMLREVDFLKDENNSIYFKHPLEYELSYENELFTIIFTPLEISLTSLSLDVVFSRFSREFINIYADLRNKKMKGLDLSEGELRKLEYLENVISVGHID